MKKAKEKLASLCKDKELLASLLIFAKWLSTIMLAVGYGILAYYLLKGRMPFGP